MRRLRGVHGVAALLAAVACMAGSAAGAGTGTGMSAGADAARDPGGPDGAGGIPLAERLSGYDQMSAPTRAMQDDDTVNPGMLWVLEGQSLWSAPGATGVPGVRGAAGAAGAACAACHGDAQVSMKGVAARYPAYDAAAARPLDLEQRINRCRTQHQKAPAWPYESRELLALTAYIAHQSRGMPISIDPDPRIVPFIAAGRAAHQRRRGQLDLACSQCHDANWQRRLGGSPITQGQPTGYPIYRLEWQNLGSLQRRLRACIGGVRAAIDDYGAPELVNLELYLMWRARGMTMESPGVRP
jgi:sulfur-oxidizing protein SoxA